MTASAPWLVYPSLAYQLAFDRCLVEVAPNFAGLTLVPSSSFYLREIARRLPAEFSLWLSDGIPEDRDVLRARVGPELDWSRITFMNGGHHPAVQTLLWVEPDRLFLNELEPLLRRTFASGGRVVALTSSWLRRLLPEWADPAPPAADPLGPRATGRLLEGVGGRLVRRYGLQGIAALFYGALARPAALLGRPDLVDRLNIAARRALLATRLPDRALLTLIVARG